MSIIHKMPSLDQYKMLSPAFKCQDPSYHQTTNFHKFLKL